MSKPGKLGEGAFIQCAKCKKIHFANEFEENLRVCSSCGWHHRISAQRRIEITCDANSFEELDQDLKSGNPLDFPDYDEKRVGAEDKTGLLDSIVTGIGRIDGNRVSLAVADFSFMGGSMGSVAGEKVTRTLERGLEKKCPAIVFCATGGARMQEGLLSLMQMAKTTSAAERCNRASIPYICVFTDPTMAGVLASYASVADVILAEPKSMVGFAGLRVSKQAGVSKVPDDFQSAEFAYNHGMIDKIVERKDLKSTLSQLVQLLGGHLLEQQEGDKLTTRGAKK